MTQTTKKEPLIKSNCKTCNQQTDSEPHRNTDTPGSTA